MVLMITLIQCGFSIARATSTQKPSSFASTPQPRVVATPLKSNANATPTAATIAAAHITPSPLTHESPSVVQPAVQQPTTRAVAAQQQQPTAAAIIKQAAATAIKTSASASPFVAAPLAAVDTAAAAAAVASSPPSSKSSTRVLAPVRPPPPTAAAAAVDRATAAQEARIAGRLANCPRFHYPNGRPVSRAENDAVRERARHLFTGTNAQIEYRDIGRLASCIGLALYAKRALYDACRRLSGVSAAAVVVDDTSNDVVSSPPPLTFAQFAGYWRAMTIAAHDEAARFIFTLAAAATGSSTPRTWLVRDDFGPLLLDIIHTYPGLSFLVQSTQFHSKYVDVVVTRIFWNVNRSWSGRINAHELRRSNFLATLRLFETVADINRITDYFSYEHFYVIYCKFWELDTSE